MMVMVDASNQRKLTLVEMMVQEKRMDGGKPPKGTPIWPPRKAPPITILNIVKFIESIIRRGTLVWLRDFDETQTLVVAVKDPSGRTIAYRYWPNHRSVILNADGSVTSTDLDKGKGKYVRHWIAMNDTDKIYMMMQNSDVYSSNPEEEQ